MEEYDLNKDKWWMELGLEFSELRIGHESVVEVYAEDVGRQCL